MCLKRLIALLVSILLMVCIALLPVSAAMSDIVQPQATYIRSADASIDVGMLSTTVTGQVSGTSVVTSVKIKLELQKKSGNTYSTIKTWEETFNARSATKTESKLTSPLSTYRLKATFTVYTSTSSETKVMYAYDN